MEDKKKKNIIIGAVILFIIIIAIIIISFISKKGDTLVDNTNKVTTKTIIDNEGNEQIISKSVEVVNTDTIKKLQSKLKLPKEYNSCKEDVDILECIVFYDKEEKTAKRFIDNEFLENKLNEIDKFKKELLKIDSINTKENLENFVADDLQKHYTLTNPAIIFDKFSCKNDFCENTIIKMKKPIVGRMISRHKMNESMCGNIPENIVKKYCLELLKN